MVVPPGTREAISGTRAGYRGGAGVRGGRSACHVRGRHVVRLCADAPAAGRGRGTAPGHEAAGSGYLLAGGEAGRGLKEPARPAVVTRIRAAVPIDQRNRRTQGGAPIEEAGGRPRDQAPHRGQILLL